MGRPKGRNMKSHLQEVARDTALVLTCREVILEATEWVERTEDEGKIRKKD